MPVWHIFLRAVKSPPAPPPPPYDRRERSTFTAVKVFGKRLNLSSWLPCHGSAAPPLHVDLMLLGDSYADDIDMGYLCWPTLVARSRSWSCLSCARGGSETSSGVGQYLRAVEYAGEEKLKITASTVVLVHLGGNDLLHALWLGPVAFLMLLMDVARVLAGWHGPRGTRLPRFSFFGFAARRVCSNLRALLLLAASNGHRTFVVSGLPVCSVVPTARFIVSLITGAWLWRWLWPGGGAKAASFVSELCDEAAGQLQAQVFDALIAANVEATRIATSGGSSAGGASMQLILIDQQRVLRDVAASCAPMWNDGHHPTARAHQLIASQIADDLAARLAPTTTVAASSRAGAAAARSRSSKSPARSTSR